MTDEVACASHGSQTAAFVCGHLIGSRAANKRLGFNYLDEPEDADDGEPCAWCDDCETFRASVDGWDEISEKSANIKLVCLTCFGEMKALNGGGRLIL